MSKGVGIYEVLNVDRDAFREMVLRRLVWSIPAEYAAHIADCISDLVAQDVRETASPVFWSDGDVGYGIGRVMMKKLGIEV